MVRVNPIAAGARRTVDVRRGTKRSCAKPVADDDVVLHPYPVTPLHGDYLYHADVAEAAKARFAGAETPVRELRVKATGSVAQAHPAWSAQTDAWDVEVFDVDAADLSPHRRARPTAGSRRPGSRPAGFTPSVSWPMRRSDPAEKQRADTDFQRLTAGDFKDLTERVNLERDLVASLTAGCRTVVAGYTVKREYFNAEFSAGIENIGYDAIEGLHSPMFLRTAKLKDFPWNGWLRLGIAAGPTAAWNPIGGMTNPFGRLMGGDGRSGLAAVTL